MEKRKTIPQSARIAVLIPCHNEQQTVGHVVEDFRKALPMAEVYVFDNASTDNTADVARLAGATVINVPRLGKGYAVQAMFTSVRSDAYVMVDGDSTYPADMAPRLLAPVLAGSADMVVGSRLLSEFRGGFRPINLLGNRLFVLTMRAVFHAPITDLLSGYRAFSRHFIQSVPIFGGGFEIEAEMTIKALERGLRVVEVPVSLANRPAGSQSKIRVLRDGFIILSTILALMRDYKPLTIFGGSGTIALLVSIVPLTLLAASGMNLFAPEHIGLFIALIAVALLGVITIASGFILHSVARHFQELNHTLSMVNARAQSYSADEEHTTRN